MKPLDKSVALVTGSSRGIGRACAVALAEAGADIAVNYLIREEAARETGLSVERAGRRALLVQADVSKANEVDRMAADGLPRAVVRSTSLASTTASRRARS